MPLRVPLHESCVKKGSLCASCSSKVKREEVEEWEVDVIRALFLALEKIKIDTDMRYYASAVAGSTLYIALEGEEVKGLEEELSKVLSLPRVTKVRLLFFRGGDLGLLERVYGQKVLSVNKVYDPDGSVQLHIKVARPDPGADKLASLLLKVNVKSFEAKEVARQRSERAFSREAKRADVKKLLDKLFS
ncbi:MAG: hypothetical protein QXP76_02995 [Acidilobaceae archaeon]